MTQPPNEQNNPNPIVPQIEKLLVDDPNHFQFHAAYLVYSDTYDAVTDAQAKKDLNQNLEDLKANKIDYETFYLNISHYRKLDMPSTRKILYADSAKEGLAQKNAAARKNKKT